MSLISSTKFILDFDSEVLTEQVSGGLVYSSNNSPITVVQQAYQMRRDQYLYKANHSFGITTDFSIAFWLKPQNPGLAVDPSGTPVGMNMALFRIGPGTAIENGIDPTGSSVVLIYEETMPLNKNRLHISVQGGARTAQTGTYSCDRWHHFLVTFYSGRIHVYIDGVINIGGGALSIPVLLGSTSNFWINDTSNSGYNWLHNAGMVKNVLILNSGITTTTAVQRIVNSGNEFFFDTDFTNTDEAEFGLYFDDPAAVKLTDFYRDGSFVYASRTDGRVLQGSPLIWEARKDFARIEEDDVLTKFGSGVEVTEGKLQITNGTVRF